MSYIKKVKLPNSDTVYDIYDDEAAHMSDNPVFALEDSEDIYADTINADTFGGRTPDEYAIKSDIVNMVYPVGSIYIAYNHTDPATLFGGAWERIKNAFLWALDEGGTIGMTGGEAEHTLTVDEMPSHRHSSHGILVDASDAGFGAMRSVEWTDKYPEAASYTEYAGGGEAHNNMPPFIQVSMWRRTA